MPPAPAPAGGEAAGAGARPPTEVETPTAAGFGDRDRRSALAPFFTSALVFGVRSAGWETSGLTTSVGALERGAAGAVTLAGSGGWCRPVVVEAEVEVLCPARAFVEPGLSGLGVFAAAPGAGTGAAWGWAPTVCPLVGTGCAAVTGTGSGWGAPAAAPEPPEAADALGCAWTAVRTWLAIALPSAAAGTAAEALLGTAAGRGGHGRGRALWDGSRGARRHRALGSGDHRRVERGRRTGRDQERSNRRQHAHEPPELWQF